MLELSNTIDSDWHPIIKTALQELDSEYWQKLLACKNWLPGQTNLFAAFSQPLVNLRYILLGESPYPRTQSANGYAFWDNAVHHLWSESGLSKDVNRATSLRNFIKMLLLARDDLSVDFSQPAIAHLDKKFYVQTAHQLFTKMIGKGFLLLNASLVYESAQVSYHAKKWRPFMQSLFKQIAIIKPDAHLLLFGKIASQIPEVRLFSSLTAEHPYNLSFINNPDVLNFFKPIDLLSNYEH